MPQSKPESKADSEPECASEPETEFDSESELKPQHKPEAESEFETEPELYGLWFSDMLTRVARTIVRSSTVVLTPSALDMCVQANCRVRTASVE